MPLSARLAELVRLLTPNPPAAEGAIREAAALTGAAFPADYLDFLRAANGGAGGDGPLHLLARLEPIEDVPRLTAGYEAPKNVFVIGSNGMGSAYCWDERRKPHEFMVADDGNFKPLARLGGTFEAFLEAVLAKGAGADRAQASPAEISAGVAPPAASAPVSAEAPAEPPVVVAATCTPLPPPAPPPVNTAKPPAFWKKPDDVVLRLRSPYDLNGVAVAMSPDDRLAATCHAADGGHAVAVWDLATGKVVKTFAGRVAGLAFAPDGRLWAAAVTFHGGGGPGLWDAVETRVVDVLSGAVAMTTDDGAHAAAFGPPAAGRPAGVVGTLSFRGRGDEYACVRDLATGRAAVCVSTRGRQGVALSADGRRFVVERSAADRLAVYDVAAGAVVFEAENYLAGRTQVAPSATGKYLASPAAGVAVLDGQTGRVVREFRELAARVPLRAAFVGDDRLLVATRAGSAHLLSVADGRELRRMDLPKNGTDAFIGVGGSGRYAVVALDQAKTMVILRL
jgi:WD40 repeat protein